MSTDDSLIKTILIVIAVIILLPFLLMMFAWPMMGMWSWGHMWNGGMWDGTGATWMWLLTLLVPLLVILGIGYLLYRSIGQTGIRQSDTALEELRITYARGEISDEEFEERRARLQGET